MLLEIVQVEDWMGTQSGEGNDRRKNVSTENDTISFHLSALLSRASSSLLLVLLFSICMRTFWIFHIGLKFNELVFISLPHIHEWMNFYFLKSIFLSMLTLDSQKGQIFHTQELFSF